MNPVDRRNFLKLAAKGSALAAAAAVLPLSGVLEWTSQGTLKFRVQDALTARENRNVTIVIDTSQKVAHADFLGTAVVLQVV